MSKTFASAKSAESAAKKALGATAVKYDHYNIVDLPGSQYGWEPTEEGKALVPAVAEKVKAAPKKKAAAKPVDLNNLSGKAQAEFDNFGTVDGKVPMPEEEAVEEKPKLGGFAGLVAQVTGDAPVVTQGKASRKKADADRKIESKREERNGLRMPSKGTLCRAIWDALDVMSEGGKLATAKGLRLQAEEQKLGWNIHTINTQFHRWSEFHAEDDGMVQGEIG